MKFPYKTIDLTHSLHEGIPTWDGGCGFQHEISLDYKQCLTDVKFRVQHVKMHGGIGTHMDAPAHCIPGSTPIDQLQLNDMIAPCFVIDVSEYAHEDYSLSVSDIEFFEKTYGIIEAGSFVVVRTGWEKFWNNPEKYRNNHIFPSISEQAAQFLLNRRIVGLGIDTLSPDRSEDGFPVHGLILGAGKYIIENVANSASLPPVGSFILALPIKIKDGTEAPVRLVALLNLE